MADKQKTEVLMDELHNKLAEVLLERVKEDEVKASDLNVARQFLKDNGIEGVPVEDSTLKNLVDELPFDLDEKEA
mgnify:FL=1|jgi:hypothetical protein|tara:strand:+ start:940 stop:1164 length:225 start_codon:yes stop_codon:yes gene_type:complete